MSFEIIPTVNDTQEFIEISKDFSNPLELVREAISNCFDAEATEIRIFFDMVDEYGEDVLKIEIEDNGTGMDKQGLQSFFDLGNSLRRENKAETHAIGEKGHGTKVFFNSKKIEVITTKNNVTYIATMDEPKKNLYNKKIPSVIVEEKNNAVKSNGTKIIIYGYANNKNEKFNHDQLRDYILWFTKFGSVEQCFDIKKNKDVILKLRGFGWDSEKNGSTEEVLVFGHVFPEESPDIKTLFDEYLVDAPKYFCKNVFLKKDYLNKRPDIEYQAVFYIEGTKVKYEYNKMLRHPGYIAPKGGYQVQDRYGLWLCKDFIPIQQKNSWISLKGTEYTKFHAFVNCQALQLTANRGSVENTPQDILDELQFAVEKIYRDIVKSDIWADLSYLEDESDAYHTVEQEKKDFDKRIKLARKTRIANHKINDITLNLIEPLHENGVYTMFTQLTTFYPDLFPFYVVNYDTHAGIDVIVKSKNQLPGRSSEFFYVEFKHTLSNKFNHSFKNLHSIICWDIAKGILEGDKVYDITNDPDQARVILTSKISEKSKNDYTRYYLDNDRSDRKIEVFVLKDYLEQKLGITFKKRTGHDEL